VLVPVVLELELELELLLAARFADFPTNPKKFTFSGAFAALGAEKLVLSVTPPILDPGTGFDVLEEEEDWEVVVVVACEVVVVCGVVVVVVDGVDDEEEEGEADDTGVGVTSEKSNSAIVFFKSSNTPFTSSRSGLSAGQVAIKAFNVSRAFLKLSCASRLLSAAYCARARV